jgi:hypothetical protein
MAHYHSDAHGGPPTTVVIERDGVSGLLIGIIAVVLAVFLIWALFFSGWAFNRSTEPSNNSTTIERDEGDTNIQVPVPDLEQSSAPTSVPTTGTPSTP